MMIHEALRLCRVYSDITQSEMSQKLGISGGYLCEIEKGNKPASYDLLCQYSVILKTSVSRIVAFSERLKKRRVRGNSHLKLLAFTRIVVLKTEMS